MPPHYNFIMFASCFYYTSVAISFVRSICFPYLFSGGSIVFSCVHSVSQCFHYCDNRSIISLCSVFCHSSHSCSSRSHYFHYMFITCVCFLIIAIDTSFIIYDMVSLCSFVSTRASHLPFSIVSIKCPLCSH